MPGICDSSVPPQLRACRLLALGDQRIERGGTLRRDRQPFGDDERDAVVGKRIRDVGNGDLQGSALCIRPTADYPLRLKK